MTARPTAGLWHALLDATSEALRGGHPHVGEEHLPYVLAGKKRSLVGGLLEEHRVRDAIRADFDRTMSPRPITPPSVERGRRRGGNLLGHMFLGEDGPPFVEPLGEDEPD